jgi:hypothetical protein
MDHINLLGIGTTIGIVGILIKAYKERDTIKTSAVYMINDLYTYYQSITQKPDSITNVQIIKNDNETTNSSKVQTVKSIDITKTFMSVPYNLDLSTYDLLKITYSYKGNEYIIILNHHNSTQFPLYTASELEYSDPNDEVFTSAIIINDKEEYVTDFTDILTKYAGPKKDFYKGKSIPFNIKYIHEIHEYLEKPYKLVLSTMMGDETKLDLLEPDQINI